MVSSNKLTVQDLEFKERLGDLEVAIGNTEEVKPVIEIVEELYQQLRLLELIGDESGVDREAILGTTVDYFIQSINIILEITIDRTVDRLKNAYLMYKKFESVAESESLKTLCVEESLAIEGIFDALGIGREVLDVIDAYVEGKNGK